jgi:photosystem II stability/assembly factor-like uncharacterized protein
MTMGLRDRSINRRKAKRAGVRARRRRTPWDWADPGLESRVLLTAPTLTVTSASVVEPDSGTKIVALKIQLSATTTQNVTFNYATADGTARVADGDYTAIPSTPGTIPAGRTSITVNVTVDADPIATEADEAFSLKVTNIVGASNTSAQGTVTIQNDDNSLSIGNVTGDQGSSGTTIFQFPVTLSGPTTTFPVTVKYKTADGTAKVADGDYVAASGTLTIPAGSNSGTIAVTVNPTSTPEANETFSVNLSSPSNAPIKTGQGTGTIIDTVTGAAWTQLGPAPIANGDPGLPQVNPANDSGRITGIAVDPTNANNIYIAAASGGVWKTTNGGTSWTPLTDGQATTAMGAIAIAPSNPSIIYAGTGEANFATDSLPGVGILKSTDGGSTWTLEGKSVFNRMCISKIVVDPTNANIVYAATTTAGVNGVYNLGGGGVWKSTDGGSTWTNTLASVEGGSTDTGDVTDLVMNPSNPLILYAAVGDIYGDAINGVYESTNGGSSWAELSGPATGTNVGRIALAISHDGQTMYVAETGSINVSTFGELTGFYWSLNGGSRFYSVPVPALPNFPGQQGWYDLVLAVDPNDAMRVYAAGSPDYNAGDYNDLIIRSDNYGYTWTSLVADSSGNGPHTDHHALAFDSSGNLLDGNDGGIWKATNPSSSSFAWNDLNGNLGITQAYGVGVDPHNANTVIMGSQDNGTVQHVGTAAWNQILGGDGGIARVDPVTPTTMYAEFSGISLVKSTDGGSTWSYVGDPIIGGYSQWIVPYTLDPSNHNRLILGTNYVNESPNQALDWFPISGVLTSTPGASITAVAIAPTAPNTVYVAYSDGTVFVTTNDGSTWTNITDTLSGLNVQGIAVDPHSSTTVYLTSYTFGGNQVWKSTNGGSSWTKIDGNLPDMPVHSIAVDGRSSPTILYVGTEAGVYESTDGGTTWAVFGSGLPHVPVFDMQLSTADNILTIGSHGRGVWQIPISSTGSPAGPARPVAGSASGPVGAGAPAPTGNSPRAARPPLAARPMIRRPIEPSSRSLVAGTLPAPAVTTATAVPRTTLAVPALAQGGTIVRGGGGMAQVATSPATSPIVALGVIPFNSDASDAVDAALDNLGGHRRTRPGRAL